MLVHGAPSAIHDYAPLVTALEADHRVIVPELPGYGKSPMLDGEYSFARVYDALETMLLEKGIRELSVVGFSLGGHHALAFAASTRVRVTSVVSLAGFAALNADDRAGIMGFVEMMSAPGASLQTPELRALLVQRFLAPPYQTEANAKQIDTWVAATTPRALAVELATEARADIRALIAKLEVPVLARVGELDLAVPRHYSEEIATLCPHGRLEVAHGHGHALLLEQPDETIAAIRAAIA